MKFRVGLLLAVLVVALASCSGVSDTSPARHLSGPTFGVSWNNFCSSHNFTDNSAVTKLTTLGDMYSGSDFSRDIALMNVDISQDLGFPSGLAGAGSIELYGWFDDLGDVND